MIVSGPMCPAAGRKGQGMVEKSKQQALLVGFVVLLALAAFLLSRSGQRGRIVGVGDRAPDFTLAALDGGELALSELRGDVVILHFWATWCPPCLPELPTLLRFSRTFGEGVHLIAASVDTGGVKEMEEFLHKNDLASLPVRLDPGGQVARRYGTVKFPETYIIDREGVVSDKVIGPLDWASSAARGRIERLLTPSVDGRSDRGFAEAEDR